MNDLEVTQETARSPEMVVPYGAGVELVKVPFFVVAMVL